MAKIFLITRPEHEYRVSYLYAWSEDILEFARNNNILFTDFKRDSASREKVEKYLKGKNPSLVIFNGHGSADAILGNKDEPLIKINDNEELLKDKIIYARACWSADSLGKSIVSKGGKCFIGYSQPFAWVHSADRTCVPATDKLAFPFRDISNIIPLSLLDGHTTKESHEKAIKLGINLIRKYSLSESDETGKEIRFWLFWDIQHQKLLGNGDAKFT